jgi:HAD superfamily hydrolase (TIGR01509 family)
MSVALLDVDGTLVDTNYQHALAWFRAFLQHDMVLPVWRIHRHIGMGGDQLIEALTDSETERANGDQIRAAEKALYLEMMFEVRAAAGARELVCELSRRGHGTVLASSADEREVEHYVSLLELRGIADGWTSASDVDATKPEPDLIQAALQRVGAEADQAVMIGDSPWDVHAARRAGVQTLAVLTGGFSAEELHEAGAMGVYESVAELREGLDQTPLR